MEGRILKISEGNGSVGSIVLFVSCEVTLWESREMLTEVESGETDRKLLMARTVIFTHRSCSPESV